MRLKKIVLILLCLSIGNTAWSVQYLTGRRYLIKGEGGYTKKIYAYGMEKSSTDPNLYTWTNKNVRPLLIVTFEPDGDLFPDSGGVTRRRVTIEYSFGIVPIGTSISYEATLQIFNSRLVRTPNHKIEENRRFSPDLRYENEKMILTEEYNAEDVNHLSFQWVCSISSTCVLGDLYLTVLDIEMEL